MHLAVARTLLADLYERLAAAGFDDLEPASAVIFQHIRPGGSAVGELARLGQSTPAAVEEQARMLEASGYLVLDEARQSVDLTPRGQQAVAVGLRALEDIGQQWRAALGDASYSGYAGALARLNLLAG